MSLFLTKTLYFIAPIILAAVIFEGLLRNIPNDYSYKKDYLDKHSENIETLILGSSHSYYGLNPEYFTSNTFNASHVAQSIDLDLEILKLSLEKAEKISHIVLPIDYFTLFTRTSLGQGRWRIKNYNIYYDLNQSYTIKENSELLSFPIKTNKARLKYYYFDKKTDISCSVLGYGDFGRPQENLIETGRLAALQHTATNTSLYPKNIEILNSILQLASNKKVKVILFTNPAYHTYVDNLNRSQLDKTLMAADKICQKFPNCTYRNILNNTLFVKEDYRDADHLNKKGAKKLSKLIDKLIVNSARM